MSKEVPVKVWGKVTNALGGDKFKIRIGNSNTITGYISGRLRKRFIRIVPGDRVKVEMSVYDLTQGRIVYRDK